jgi:hypothetical protein
MTALVLVVLLRVAAVTAAPVPDTLVTAGSDGAFAAALAISWQERADGVTFKLAAGVDADAVVRQLGAALHELTVARAGDDVLVTGAGPARILALLAATHLTTGWESLPDLDQLGESAPLPAGGPEVGGSIRAKHSLVTSPWPPAHAGPRRLARRDARERIEALVIAVERGPFPMVRLTVKLRAPALAGPARGKLAAGAVLTAPVAFATSSAGVDYADPDTQRNLGALFVAPGDRVTVTVGETAGGYELDFVTRP